MVQLICSVNRVICGPVSAGLIPFVRVRSKEVRPPNRKGIPVLAGRLGLNTTETTGKTSPTDLLISRS